MSNVALSTRRSRAPIASSPLLQAGAFSACLVRSCMEAWRTRRELQLLPDYLLDDIGISRADIDFAVELRRNTRSANLIQSRYFG